jgi:hypothetical protein
MSPKFIGESIEVTTEGDVKEPASFVWRGRTYEVTEVIAAWLDWGFAAGSVQRNWRTRRHRNYFRVHVSSGETFEIYVDRGPAGERSEWFLYQQLQTG